MDLYKTPQKLNVRFKPTYQESAYKTIDYRFDSQSNVFKPREFKYNFDPQSNSFKKNAAYNPLNQPLKLPKGSGTAAVAVGGFALGYGIGTAIYNYAETPNNAIQGIADRLQRTGRFNDNPTPETRGGREVQTAEYPFKGGQVQGAYYRVYIAYKQLYNVYPHTVKQESDQALAITCLGPISLNLYGSTTEFYWQNASLTWELKTAYRWHILSNGNIAYNSGGEWYYAGGDTVKITRVERVDGTSEQDDINQGGNPQATRQSIVTNITNNYTTVKKQTVVNNNIFTGTATNNSTGTKPGQKTPVGTTTTIRTGTQNITNTGTQSPSSPSPKANPYPDVVGVPISVPVGVPYLVDNPDSSTSQKQKNKIVPSELSLPPAVPILNTKTPDKETIQPKTETETKKENKTGITDTGGFQCCTPDILPKMDRKLDLLQTGLQGADLTLLGVINNKLGDQIQGGIGGFMTKAFRATRFDKVVNFLSLLVSLHNAAMLSRNLVDSLSTLIESGLEISGLKNEKDEDLNINETIGNTVETFLKGFLGEEVYTGVSTTWKKASAIWTSAVNVYELMLSSMSGIAEGLETVSRYTGKVGNALKKSGVVLENSYQWMDENIRIKTGRFAAVQKVIDGLQSAEEVTSNLTEVTSTIQETTETVNQMKTEMTNIKTQISNNETAKNTTETTAKTNSTGATIELTHLNKPGS
jgi:hypothetical protein